MKKFRFAILALAAVLAATPRAKADTFTFSSAFDGSLGESGTFTVTGSIVYGSILDATSGTLTITGAQYNGTFSLYGSNNPVPLGNPSFHLSPNAHFPYDNLLFPGFDGPLVTIYGLLFTQGGVDLRIWATAPNYYSLQEGTSTADFAEDDFVVLSPEPNSLLLLASGLLILAFAAFCKLRCRTPIATT
ncbi:MAG: hypothetical protein ABSD59_05040 [Terracidiphilus sp.]|jgi:hypothetical protein